MPGGENAELFRNRKGFFQSMHVQAVSGPNLEFQNIVVRWTGSVHDSRIFENICLSVCVPSLSMVGYSN